MDAFVALVAGAVVTLIFLLAAHPKLIGSRFAAEPVSIPGAALDGSPADGSSAGPLRVSPTGAPRQTVLVPVDALDSRKYGYLRLRARVPADVTWFFLWRNQRSHDLHAAPLFHVPGDGLLLRLAGKSQWGDALTGEKIEAVGIGFVNLRDSVTIESLRLEPASVRNFLSSLWQEWFGFEGEQPYSQNFIVGAPPDLRQLVKPLPVVGGWFFLSLAMLYGLARFRRTQPLPPAVLLVFVACWFSIDSRWQLDLLTQNRLTAARYAGLNDAEKHAAGAHPELVSFAREIHAALPAGMQTIHIFAQRKPEQRFSKLRLNWLLLPHQISYSRIKPAPLYPPRPGEFVVVLRDHQFLRVDTDAGLLRWPAGTPAKPESKSLRVTVLLDHPSGFLLRVEP